MKFGSLLFIN